MDLPGYGYRGRDRARCGGTGVSCVEAYFESRRSLKGVIVVMDIRHPMTRVRPGRCSSLAQGRDVPVHVLLTKADKLGRGAIQQTAGDGAARVGVRRGGAAFSAHSGLGRRGGARPMDAWLAGRQHAENRVSEKETPAGPAEPAGED